MEFSVMVPSYLRANKSSSSPSISDFQINMKAIRNDFHLSKADDFMSLLESDSYTDVRFICKDGEAVACHGSVLASVSPMLKEWMLGYLYNPDKYFSILLPDIPGSIMKYFVQLLYGRTLVLHVPEQYTLLKSLSNMLNIESSKILLPNHPSEPSSLPLCCWRCGASFALLSNLKAHVSEKHTGEKIRANSLKRHKCTKCKKVLPSMWKLRQHLLTHNPSNASANNDDGDHQYADPRRRPRKSIPIANPSDHPYSSRTLEKRQKGGSSNTQSARTVKKAPKKDASLHSYASEEPELISSDPPFKCNRCSKVFPKKYRLVRHVEEVHDQVKKFTCTHGGCSKAFFKKTSLSRHALTHTELPVFRCEHCSKQFRDPSGLKYHIAKDVCRKRNETTASGT